MQISPHRWWSGWWWFDNKLLVVVINSNELVVITFPLAEIDGEGFFTWRGSYSAGSILRTSIDWNHLLQQRKPWFALFFEGIQIYPTFIIMIAIMITILVFHYGFFDSVTFILPCHCLAVLTKGVSRGGTARVFHRGGAYNRTSLPPSASKFLVSKAAGDIHILY